MKSFFSIWVVSILCAMPLAKANIKKSEIKMVSIHFSVPILVHDQCESTFYSTVTVLGCAYDLGGSVTADGEIKNEKIIGDDYYDAEIFVSGARLVVIFKKDSWIDSENATSSNAMDFLKEVESYILKNPHQYEFEYRGPNIEVDLARIGRPIQFDSSDFF